MKKNTKIFSFSVSVLLIVAGFLMTASLAYAIPSTIASQESEMLPSPEVKAKANAVVPTTTFSLIQNSGSATLNSITVMIVDPGASGLVNTDIASVSLMKESGAHPDGFQADEDLLVTGALANTPAIGVPVTLTPTPEVIGASPVKYYIVITIAASPVNGHSLAVNLGANYGIDSLNGTIGSALTATKKVTIDMIAPSDPSAGDYTFVQNAPGTPDQFAVKQGVSVGIAGDTVNVYDGATGNTLLGSGSLGGSPVQFAPIAIGDNANDSVKVEFVDPAGNASLKILVPAIGAGNDITAPTVTSVAAFTDRMIVNFSENVDGMQASNCANYTVNGSVLSCSGPGTPFIDFQGNKATIKGLNLSSSATLVITGGVIKDINGGQNPLATYTSGSLSVSALTLPTISSISPSSGAVGASVTITGTNFDTGTAGDANHKVFFSGGFDPNTGPLPPVEAISFTSWSATSIVVAVPAGAQGGPVNVMVSGVMSDMGQNSFFDIAGNYTAKVWYDANKTISTTDATDASNIRIVIMGMRGPMTYSTDGSSGNTMAYDNGTKVFTITGVASMGFTYAYDIRGTHLNSAGAQINTSATQDLIMLATSKRISGTITMGSPCSTGTDKDVVIFAMPDQVDTGATEFKEINPAFFRTNGSCIVNYSIGISADGVYRVEAHIPPDVNALAVSSSTFTDPSALSVTIGGAGDVSGKNFTFTAATHKIMGIVKKPVGDFGADQKGMLWVFAYQPRENGKGTGTQVAADGTFILYVTPGTWKVGISGENMPFPVEIQVDVDSTYAIASYTATTKTIIIAPPSDFIEGYVKDSAGNGLANVSLYSWLEGGPGGGNANTDSQGYYKMYVTPGSNYHVGANSQAYGFLGEQSNITVSNSTHPTVNFTVSASDNFTISGTVTKGGSALQQAFVFITDGENGQMLGSGGTDATGAFTVRVSGGSNRWLHIGLPAKGEIYKEALTAFNNSNANDLSHNIAITSSTIKVRIYPIASFTQAFVGVHSDTGGGFSDTDVAVGKTYREYQIDVQRSATYYVDGGIPGYGPLPQISVAIAGDGTFTESLTNQSGGVQSTTDGIIEITLGGLYTVSGTVTGTNVKDAWVFASGPNGGGGGAVAENGTYSFKLKNGTYDIGVGKPGYIGNKITTIVNGADVPTQDLILTTSSNTITGTVYLPDGTTPAVNAQVWAENGTGGMGGGSTDASGNYSLSVGSGSWTVKAAYDGYNSNGILVTAPATSKNIILITVAGFTPNTKNSPITPSDGGIMSGIGFKIDFPKNSLGTGSSAGTVEVKSTTNVVTKNDRQLVGTAKEFTVRDSNNQNVTTLSGSATIELTVSRAELVDSGLAFSKIKDIKITYYDSTGGSWIEIPTVVTLSVPAATTILDLDVDPAITLTGTTTHLSTYAPSIPTDSDAPSTPTGLSATAGNVSASLSWTASAGATKYDIYKKVGDDYPYLAQTTSTSYSASGLTNNTIYYFKVSALDGSDRESAATSEVSVTPVAPSPGGGGSYTPPDTTPPTSTSISINAGATTASSLSVTLTLAATGASQMIISNNAGFTGASWETYVTSKPWTLTLGDGIKTVYVKFRDAALNVSSAVSDSITVSGSGTSAIPATPATPAVPGENPAILATPATPVVKLCPNGKTISSNCSLAPVVLKPVAKTYNFGTKTLKNGSKGNAVMELQRFLNQVLNLGLKVDGKLGPKTIAVIKKWQKANGLVADGLVGIKTKAKMNSLTE